MAQWLYRYIFRGIGIVLIAGLITMLTLAIRSQLQTAKPGNAVPANVHRR